LLVLNKIHKEYKMPLPLYANLKNSINYSANNDVQDIHDYVEQLPHKLKVEVSKYLYKDLSLRLEFLKGKTPGFIAWICPLFKPVIFEMDKYIYFEGDDVSSVYLLKKGSCGFVLPKHQNSKFVHIDEGKMFGVADIIGSMYKNDSTDPAEWLLRKDLMCRQFTTMADTDIEVLSLSVNDLLKIHIEF
jgi:hypothetical protein